MEWIEQLNQALDYIEGHLTDQIDPVRLGQIACCSPYHFQRMFGYMAGMPLSEYIRRRRMSLAAAELWDGTQKVVDIALKYQYDSPTAFNRAFQTVQGFAPSAARQTGAVLKSFPPIRFSITIKGAIQMDYRIEQKEAFRIVGASIALDADLEKNFGTVPQFWGKAGADGTIGALAAMMNTPIKGILGVSDCDSTQQGGRYFISVASTLPEGNFEVFEVPAATWAVFSGGGSGISIQELQQRIVTDWLPTSGYEYASGPDIEVYLNPDPQNMQYEVWLPVAKKQDTHI